MTSLKNEPYIWSPLYINHYHQLKVMLVPPSVAVSQLGDCEGIKLDIGGENEAYVKELKACELVCIGVPVPQTPVATRILKLDAKDAF